MNTNQKGFASIILIIIIITLVVIGAGYFTLVKKQKPVIQQTLPPTAQHLVTQPLAPTSTSNIENWKTYTNEKYGFEFKYPNGWEFSDKAIADEAGNGPKLKSDGNWTFSPSVAVGNPLTPIRQTSSSKFLNYPLYVIVTSNPKKYSAVDFATEVINQVLKDSSGNIIKVIYKDKFPLMVGSIQAYELYGLFGSEEQIYFTKNDMAYLISFPIPDNTDTAKFLNSKDNNAIAHQILSTFKFVN